MNRENRRGGVLTVGTMEARAVVGLGLDLRLFAERHTPAQAVVVAVSAQGNGQHDVAAVSADSIDAQFASLAHDEIWSVRVGALPTVAAIECVAAFLAAFRPVPVVIDPVVASSLGGALVREDTAHAFRRKILPLATIVLPNLAEARALTGEVTNDVSGMEVAARALVAAGARAALVTGGHLAGDPTDLLVDGESPARAFSAPRIGRDMRGTGCVLAASLAAEFADGGIVTGVLDAARLAAAVARARETVRTKIAHAKRMGDQWVVAAP